MSLPAGGTGGRGRFIPEPEQTAVWLLGGLAQVRVPGEATGNSFTVVQHTGARGYDTPLHVHDYEDEIFLVLDGTLRLVCDGEQVTAGAGSAFVVPRTVSHGFVTVSDEARFLTIHSTPDEGRRPQFDLFLAAELPRAAALTLPAAAAGEAAVERPVEELIALGEKYAFRHTGPPPTP